MEIHSSIPGTGNQVLTEENGYSGERVEKNLIGGWPP
jgi:hypothetical protein